MKGKIRPRNENIEKRSSEENNRSKERNERKSNMEKVKLTTMKKEEKNEMMTRKGNKCKIERKYEKKEENVKGNCKKELFERVVLRNHLFDIFLYVKITLITILQRTKVFIFYRSSKIKRRKGSHIIVSLSHVFCVKLINLIILLMIISKCHKDLIISGKDKKKRR